MFCFPMSVSSPLLGGYDEPEILRCSIPTICPKGADVRHITASVDNSEERHGIRAYIESYGRPALKIGDPKAGKQIVPPCTTFRRHASAKPLRR